MDPMGVRYRYGRIGKTNTSPPVSRNIAFPRDLLLDFHYGSPPYFSFSLSLCPSYATLARSHTYRLLRENDSGSGGTGYRFLSRS